MRSPNASRFYLGAVLGTVAVVVVLIIAGVKPLPAVVFGLVAIAFFTAWTLTVANRGRERRAPTARADERDAGPAAALVPDEETPLGATTEQHEEISPHDIPPGNPARHAAEEQAARSAARGGQPLTTGDVDDGPAVVRDDDLRTDLKETGERRFKRDEVEWTAEDQERGQVRGRRSRQYHR
jgi:hypothetical protein